VAAVWGSGFVPDAGVEQDGRMRSVLARVVAVAAVALGLCIVAAWVANFALMKTGADVVSTDPVVMTMAVLGWVELGLAVVVLAGLATGAWLHRPLWARGVASVIIGMALYWGWWLLDRRVDLFGTSSLELSPSELISRVEVRMWTTLGTDVVAVLALLLGGVLLLRHRSRPESDAISDDSGFESELESVEQLSGEHASD
jgi:hypothetical protein